jgi:hypothetical protein
MHSPNLLPNPETTFQAIANIVRFAEAAESVEQRISVRQQVLQAIVAEPLDANFQNAGETFQALSRDVSVAGVGFFATVPTRARWLRLDFVECDQASVIVEVVHQSERGPFWMVGCKFLVDWESADWDEFDSDSPRSIAS